MSCGKHTRATQTMIIQTKAVKLRKTNHKNHTLICKLFAVKLFVDCLPEQLVGFISVQAFTGPFMVKMTAD